MCPLTSGETPTDGKAQTPGLFTRLIRADCPESTKHWVLLASAVALIMGFVALVISCSVRIWRAGDVGSGAVAALVCVSGPLAILAGAAHAKKDEVTP